MAHNLQEEDYTGSGVEDIIDRSRDEWMTYAEVRALFNSIEEQELRISNEPTDGYLLGLFVYDRLAVIDEIFWDDEDLLGWDENLNVDDPVITCDAAHHNYEVDPSHVKITLERRIYISVDEENFWIVHYLDYLDSSSDEDGDEDGSSGDEFEEAGDDDGPPDIAAPVAAAAWAMDLGVDHPDTDIAPVAAATLSSLHSDLADDALEKGCGGLDILQEAEDEVKTLNPLSKMKKRKRVFKRQEERTMETDPNDYTVIKEGEAEILLHKKNQVFFFNKAQVNNRDMSIAVLREFISKRKQEHEAAKSSKGSRSASKSKVIDKDSSEMKNQVTSEDGLKEPAKTTEGLARGEPKPPKVLEALSASGLRALRYAREIEGIGQVVALDNDLASVEACQRNIKFNGSLAISKVESHHTDARVHMLTHPKEFDVVDLDPYGSPSIFLDSAVQSVADGGLLMCTATDMAVLCGGNGEVCYSKYGSYPLRGKYCHEMALRILLASIESHANRYKRYIVPVLSVQMDFYVRVFVRVYTSASAMKNTPLKLSYVYQCIGCDSFHLQPVGRSLPKNKSVRYLPATGPVVAQECSHCGKKYNMGGPIWSAPMHDQEWVTSILNSVTSMKQRYPAFDRIYAVLTTVSEELIDVPLFLSLHNLCATLKCISPSAAMFRSAVINAQYRISGTHVNPLGMKTDAPMEVIWDIMRCWVKNHPIKAQSPEQPGSVILSKEPSHQVDFSRQIGSMSKAQAKKVARFLPNPEKHWGPKLRAGRQITSKHVSLIGHEAVNGHLSQNHEELKEEEEDAEQEDNLQEELDPKRQKTTEDISSTS